MFDVKKLEWTREPESYDISDGRIEIITNRFMAEDILSFQKRQCTGIADEDIREIFLVYG